MSIGSGGSFFWLVWNVAHLWLEGLGTPDAEVDVDI
jgi:hypothetical protein